MGWLRKRFGEGSTYAGLAMAAMLAGQAWPQYADLIHAAVGVLAGGAVVVPDAGNR